MTAKDVKAAAVSEVRMRSWQVWIAVGVGLLAILGVPLKVGSWIGAQEALDAQQEYRIDTLERSHETLAKAVNALQSAVDVQSETLRSHQKQIDRIETGYFGDAGG